MLISTQPALQLGHELASQDGGIFQEAAEMEAGDLPVSRSKPDQQFPEVFRKRWGWEAAVQAV